MNNFDDISEEDTQVEGATPKRPEPPEKVPGRILHYDADFAAYMCGYKWEEEPVEKSIESLRMLIQTVRIMAGAETIHLHLTMGNKAGRYEIAKVKEYQGKRETTEGLALRVSELRHWMANCTDPHTKPVAWTDREADDGITQAMWEAHHSDEPHLAVMWSRDKDLYMAVGLHMDADTFEITCYPNGFGTCRLDRNTTQTKVVGSGYSFFFHQLLMGDTADNIPGLPFFTAKICEEVWPTKAMLAAEDRLSKARTPKKAHAAHVALEKLREKIKPKTVGAVKAYEYLQYCNNEMQAFRRVREAYAEYYGVAPFQFTDWRGNTSTMTAGEMLLEQARLLWMQRTPGEDVLDYFKEISK